MIVFYNRIEGECVKPLYFYIAHQYQKNDEKRKRKTIYTILVLKEYVCLLDY